MTIDKVIAQLRHRNRETAPDIQVARWCSVVDTRVAKLVSHEDETVEYNWPADKDTELAIGDPWGDVYYLYCTAQIDLDKRQYSDFNNMIEEYEKVFSDFARAYRRKNRPASTAAINVM